MTNKDSIELKSLLGTIVSPKFEVCQELLLYLFEVDEIKHWDNHKFVETLRNLTDRALDKLQ